MAAIGQTLREARERLGLTLEEAERATRIRTHHLEALEREAWDALPSPVQARGFLRNYADFLGLDADAILLDYVNLLQNRRTHPAAIPSRSLLPQSKPGAVRIRRPRWISADLITTTLVVLAVMAVIGWGASRVMAGFRERTEAEATAAAVLPTSEATPSATIEVEAASPAVAAPVVEEQATATSTVAPPPILSSLNVINLRLAIERRAWVRVTVDGTEKYVGRAAPGDSLEFQAQSVIEVTTGNGGGVRVFYQGQDMGLLGQVDEVVIRLWTLEGMLTPTATATATATPTPFGAATPTAPGG